MAELWQSGRIIPPQYDSKAHVEEQIAEEISSIDNTK